MSILKMLAKGSSSIDINKSYYQGIYTGNGSTRDITTGLNLSGDGGLVLIKSRDSANYNYFFDTLVGATKYIRVAGSKSTGTIADSLTAFGSTTYSLGADATFAGVNSSPLLYVTYAFKVTPTFFYIDKKALTTGTPVTVDLSSLVTVGMVIVTRNDAGGIVYVYHKDCTAGKILYAEQTAAETTDSSISLSGTTLTISGSLGTGNYSIWAWASLPGVTSIGKFTGNGSTQTINCGFSTGARFVLIKAISTTGNWAYGDAARGLVAGNDPYLLINSTAAEVGTQDWLDPNNSGFVVNETTGPNANTNSVSYAYIAIQ